MSTSTDGALVDSNGHPVRDSQGNPVLIEKIEEKRPSEIKETNVIPISPDETDPAYVAYLRSLDKNGDAALDNKEIAAFLEAIDATFRERSKSPRIQGFCSLASTMSINGILSDAMLERVESTNKERAHKMVNDYLGTDTAKGIFKNGIAEVTDANLAPIIHYALNFAKACAAK